MRYHYERQLWRVKASFAAFSTWRVRRNFESWLWGKLNLLHVAYQQVRYMQALGGSLAFKDLRVYVCVCVYICVVINECRIFCINVAHFIHTTVYTSHRESLFLFPPLWKRASGLVWGYQLYFKLLGCELWEEQSLVFLLLSANPTHPPIPIQ